MRKLIISISLLVTLPLLATAQVIPGERQPLPGEEKQLLTALKNCKPGIEKIETLLKLSAYYVYLPFAEKEDLKKALLYNQLAKQSSNSADFQDQYTEALVICADIYMESGDDKTAALYADSALELVQNTLRSLQSHKQPTREIRALRQLAAAHQIKSNYVAAEENLLKIIKLYQAHGFTNLHYTYNRLAIVCTYTGEYNKGLNYSLEAVKTMEHTGDTTGSGDIYMVLGIIYGNIGEFQKGIDCYKKGMDYYRSISAIAVFDLIQLTVHPMLKMKRHNELITLLKKTMKDYPNQDNLQKMVIERAFGSCYRDLKQYNLAEIHYLRMFKLKVKDSTITPIEYKLMGQLYVEAGKYAMAKPYLDKAVELGSDKYPPNWLAHLHFLMFKTDSAAGNYLSAIDHLMKNKALDDLVYEQTKVSSNQEAQIKYETEKKDKELLLKQQNIELLRRDGLLKQANLQQAKKDKNMFVVGGIMLFLLLALLYNRYHVKQKNIKEINNKNLTLQHLVTEKEWLLKEVHHRVKNNLQTVVSLLESQTAYLQDDALLAIQDSQNRVYTMALIHQKLYQAENVASISMEQYLPELVSYLRQSFDIRSITFHLDVEPLNLDVSQAIPVGLIVNEAITNSIKYAFPANIVNRQVSVSLSQHNGDHVLLVSDNGIGVPKELIGGKTSSLGLKLIKGLAEDLGGKYHIDSTNGTTISITFQPNELLHKRPQAPVSTLTGVLA